MGGTRNLRVPGTCHHNPAHDAQLGSGAKVEQADCGVAGVLGTPPHNVS